MTDPSPTCPDCGTALPTDSPQSLCPACLMRQALASRTLVNGSGKSNTAAPPLSPDEIADKFPAFEILECLGRGGMGVVYKARQKSLNRLVAIKILAPERETDSRFAERFAHEAELLAKLSHPHIVTIHDFGETGGFYYLVMEFVDGVNLRDLLRDGKIEAKQALAIVPPICEALQFAHDKGIVHRDIKPENLLLDRDGRVKIADFGIASLVGVSGESAGTPPYMAPEQASHSEVDHRADIYALGVVLYEMLTGERPGKEVVAPSKKVQIDVRLDEIVLRALEKNPELRFQEASIFKTQVETLSPGNASDSPAQTGVAASGPSSIPGPTWPPDHPAKSTGLGKWRLGILVGTVLGVPFLWSSMSAWEVIFLCGLALVLSLVLGLMSWRSRSGKFAIVASGMGLLIWWVVFAANLLFNLPFLHAPKEQVIGGLDTPLAPLTNAGDAELPRFGPVIERVLPAVTPGTACLLDFESGRFVAPPDRLAEKMWRDIERTDLDRSELQWMGDSQADAALLGATEHTVAFIGTMEFARSVAKMSDGIQFIRFDDYTPELFLESIRKHSFERKMKNEGIYSASVDFRDAGILFVTAQGSMGLMEILGPNDDPSGLKIRYKLMQGANPPTRAVAAAQATHELPPLVPVMELKIPPMDLPDMTTREGYRLTVEPREGNYVLATIREYEGHAAITKDTPVKRETLRLIRTPGDSHSEDIYKDSHWAMRPNLKNRKGSTATIAATDRCVISGFGQQVVITDLDFEGAPGGSVDSGGADGHRRTASAWKRFEFADFDGDKKLTRIVEFELKVVTEDKARELAEHHSISLPPYNVANWAITLSVPTVETPAEATSIPFAPAQRDYDLAAEGMEEALLPGGRSPDGRYEVRVRGSVEAPYGYEILVYAAGGKQPIHTLADVGGILRYTTAREECKALWHPSSKFVVVTDQPTKHSRVLHILAVSGDRVERLKAPDYAMNAIGRADAVDHYRRSVSTPQRWEGDDLHLNLRFDTRDGEFSSEVVLHLSHGENVALGIDLKSVSPAKPAGP